MKNGQPQRIYKYLSLSGKFGRPAVSNAILNNRLYWQTPTEFNDPFDCSPIFYFGDNDAERKKACEQITSEMAGSRTERAKYRADLRKKNPDEVAEILSVRWLSWMRETAITCFTTNNSHELMWAHYADKHRGICLMFDEDIENDFFGLPVDYPPTRQKINVATLEPNKFMRDTMLTKSQKWKYEEELRIINWRGNAGYKLFPPDCLKGVILGSKISPDDEEYIRKLSNRRPNLSLCRAVADRHHYEYNIVSA